MKLYYPVRNPIKQDNLFGANPKEYAPLHQAGHPGNDFECPMFTPVYAPCDGAAFYTTDSLGGDGIYIRTPDSPNPSHNVILWHMVPAGDPLHPYSIPTARGTITDVKAGQLLGYSGNSGFPRESTGPHLHLGVMPIGSNDLALNPNNGYLGCVDPAPFYNGLYAEDINKVQVATVAVSEASLIANSIESAPISQTDKISLRSQLSKVLIAIANFLGYKD